MAKHKKDKPRGPAKYSWKWCKKRGAIRKPDFTPECPQCNGVDCVADEPYNGGIFSCENCAADIVVMEVEGYEYGVLVEELDDPAALKHTLAEVCFGSPTYSPCALVEDR